MAGSMVHCQRDRRSYSIAAADAYYTLLESHAMVGSMLGNVRSGVNPRSDLDPRR